MDSNDLCLIRKGGFILGPYTYEKTKTLLLQRELKVIDEIVFPGGHWTFLRECPVFANIVEKLRKQDLISDDENTETVNRYSTSISYTSSMARINNSELFEGKDKRHISAVEVLSSEPVSAEGHYGSAQYAKKKSKKGMWPIWGLLGLLTLIFGYVTYSSKQAVEPPAVKANINFSEEGLLGYSSGQYKKALSSFQKAYSSNRLDPKALIPYGALLLNDKQTVAASRVFNEAMDAGSDSKHKALVGMGLLSLLDGEVRFADKNFEEALKINSDYVPALFNLGVTRFYKNKFSEASDYFKSSYQQDPKSRAAHTMHAISLIKSYEESQNITFLDQAYEKLTSGNEPSSNYRQESLLLMSYIYFLKKDLEAMEPLVKSLLDEDPYLTENHRKNLLLHDSLLNWVFLNKEFCRKIIDSGLGSSSLNIQMLNVVCLAKSGQLSFAEKRIEGIKRQNSQNPLLGALSAYVQRQSNSKDEALVTIGNAIDNNRLSQYKLPSTLQAQYCEEVSDFECALKFWTKTASIDPSMLSAKVGRIASQIRLGQMPSSKKDIKNLLELSPGYVPLLLLLENSNE